MHRRVKRSRIFSNKGRAASGDLTGSSNHIHRVRTDVREPGSDVRASYLPVPVQFHEGREYRPVLSSFQLVKLSAFVSVLCSHFELRRRHPVYACLCWQHPKIHAPAAGNSPAFLACCLCLCLELLFSRGLFIASTNMAVRASRQARVQTQTSSEFSPRRPHASLRSCTGTLGLVIITSPSGTTGNPASVGSFQ